ncbi:MFS transporter [Pseudomonadota bacterium]
MQSPWAPFRNRTFCVLWAAIVISNIGTWMHDVAAGWLMATLTSSPFLVASVQAATTLPIFVLALPSGALSDIVDRRKLLIMVKVCLTIVASLLCVSVYTGIITPIGLILFTLLMGTGAAFIAPAWQAVVPQIVPRENLQQAIALNSVGINISRAIGPAVGGVMIATVGLWSPFLLNALSFLVVIAALVWWRQPVVDGNLLPAERFASAIRAGLRFSKESAHLRGTLIRALGFFVFATAYWSLLPLIARDLLNGDSTFYGFLLATIGAGALLGALVLPSIKRLIGSNKVVGLGAAGTGVVLIIFSQSTNQIAGVGACLLAGMTWLWVLSSLNVSTQLALPEWVRGRGLSVFITVYFGGMAGGSILWGNVAGFVGIPVTLLIAAAGALIAIPITWRWKLLEDADINLTPSFHWTVPVIATDIEDDRGPVMVTVEYNIDPANSEEFLKAMNEYGNTRKRDGAFAWGVFEDVEQPGKFMEYFLVESWLEHMRQHHRVTKSDVDIEHKVLQFHLDKTRPRARHLVGYTAHSTSKSDK